MNLWFLENQTLLRLIFFSTGFFIFMFLGLYFRYRQVNKEDYWRWLNNMGLTFVNTLLVRVFFPVTLVTFAQNNTSGVLNYFKIPNYWIEILVSIIILDLIIYMQHILFHKAPFLWRLHAVHHSDTGFDVTTALRFHPLEIVLSVLVKAAVIILLGFDPLAVIIFEIILNFSSMFNHANFSLPKFIEDKISLIVVTPSLHRIHHSPLTEETNSNFGFFLSIWDKMFQTLKKQSTYDLRSDDVGLKKYRNRKDQRIDALLYQPIRGIDK